MRGKSFKEKDSGENILMNYQYNYDKMDNIMDKATRDWGHPLTQIRFYIHLIDLLRL